MCYVIVSPEDKLTALKTWHIRPETCIAVGDGYTDIPLLDKASVPILMDRTGGNHRLVKAKGYQAIASISELLPLIIG
jgi:phosphoserine phosphatase